MVEHVLVPFDGSPLAERALRHALKRFPGAAVTVAYVVDPTHAIAAVEGGGLPVATGWADAARDHADEVLAGAASLASERGADVDTVTLTGRPARELLAYADEHGVDHVVVGSHGRSRLERAILGSVAERVVRRAAVPVTVVR